MKDLPLALQAELDEARLQARISNCEDKVQYNLGIIKGIRTAVLEMRLDTKRKERVSIEAEEDVGC
jgi:putative component of toxin-antitoxin plasmid stabilization module